MCASCFKVHQQVPSFDISACTMPRLLMLFVAKGIIMAHVSLNISAVVRHLPSAKYDFARHFAFERQHVLLTHHLQLAKHSHRYFSQHGCVGMIGLFKT